MKLLSVDPANYNDAPTEGIRRVLGLITGKETPKGEQIDLSDVESIRMGTTVATNALLERKGDRVAFLVTKGFKDILTIGQQARPQIFDLTVAKMGHLHELVYEIDERITVEGYSENPIPENFDEQEVEKDENLVYGVSGEVLRVLKKPNVEQIRQVLQKIWDSGIRSLAITLMHSYIYPDHEEVIAKEARGFGFEHVSVSSEIQPMIKIVSRANSTTADAYLSPITGRYIQDFGKGFKGGLDTLSDKLLFMQSDGGLTSWNKFSGLRAILSGPAGGVVGYAKTSYEENSASKKRPAAILGFDMGGTSTDVSRYNGHFDHIFETTTAEVTIQAPQLDINTVAAGGGSILFWKKGLFVVGPESASAHPGPACYRKGGPLTVTDANLFLGRILPEYFPKIFGPNENEPLDYEIVKQKFEKLTQEINDDKKHDGGEPLTPQQVATGFLKVANESMCRPIRSLTEGKGYTTSDHHLASFGGAGGQHACEVAVNLGISRVIIHKYSSLLSAYGMTLADVVHEVQRPESITLDSDSLPGLNERLDEIGKEAEEALAVQGFKDGEQVEIERYLNLKYKGTETFIMVKQTDDKTFEKSFIEQHEQEFGFGLEREILVGDIRVRGIGKSKLASQKQTPAEDLEKYSNVESKPEITKTSQVYFDDWYETNVYQIEDLNPGDKCAGPSIIIDKTQTIVVNPDSIAIALPSHVVIDFKTDSSSGKQELDSKIIDPIQLSVFGHRFMSIAEQMGQALKKTAISTNIKERLDFSCAIFSPDGGLVANAPHIPVHLGSMSSAVAYQRQMWDGKLKDGDVLVANHPAYGGSHLPDLTVITPVFSQDGKDIIFWAASRGHHSDIGGITAGSMPPFSKEIWEEGAMIQGFKVVEGGRFNEQGLIDTLYNEPSKFPNCSGSRSLSDSISDLKAQIAANNKGINLLKGLIGDFGLEVMQLYMHGIQDNAERSVRQLLKQVAKQFGAGDDNSGQCILEGKDQMDDGTEVCVKIAINSDSGDATFDFTGTGRQVYANWNAPRAITYSAVLYVLRSMIQDDIPLNQGCLTPIKFVIPEGCLLSPTPDAAVVAGNVETSQVVVGAVLRAFNYAASAQCTCNNFTFGFGGESLPNGRKRPGFGYYDTNAGGMGATAEKDGQSAVQCHMTNTRATDPEILEKRYPCILHTFGIRRGSGGVGLRNGGDGLIRDIEFRIPMQVSILSEKRSVEPFGLEGGGNGKKGKNIWIRASDGRVVNLGGKNTVHVNTDDHIILKTPGGGAYGLSS